MSSPVATMNAPVFTVGYWVRKTNRGSRAPAARISIFNAGGNLVKPQTLPAVDNVSMLRDQNLIPLSRQHQHALALCVRIQRASLSTAAERTAWQSEIQQHFEQEIQHHFTAEEAHLFPAARLHPDLVQLVDELL